MSPAPKPTSTPVAPVKAPVKPTATPTPAKPQTVPAAPVKPTPAPNATATPKLTTNQQKIVEAWNAKTLDEQKAMVKASPSLANAMAKYGLTYKKDNAPSSPATPAAETPAAPAA